MTSADMTRAARPLFVSPHLDDAVFGCGALIATCSGALVATVFAGRPASDLPLTSWDGECGFRAGDDVVGIRRDEDRQACGLLGARPIWLDYLDDQYGDRPEVGALTASLDALVAMHEPECVFVPLGLFHADHRRASDAALALVESGRHDGWYAYEDAIYRCIPGEVASRTDTLRGRGYALVRQHFQADGAAQARKAQAVACYRSQLAALAARPASGDTRAPEAYWGITRA
ncbi:MAG TPA: PIG-L family deacetylase [Casimicrobiaceae bacterium]|nr:PIG-L family deacetylase [Casimicrobiaceae bacterium]